MTKKTQQPRVITWRHFLHDRQEHGDDDEQDGDDHSTSLSGSRLHQEPDPGDDDEEWRRDVGLQKVGVAATLKRHDEPDGRKVSAQVVVEFVKRIVADLKY